MKTPELTASTRGTHYGRAITSAFYSIFKDPFIAVCELCFGSRQAIFRETVALSITPRLEGVGSFRNWVLPGIRVRTTASVWSVWGSGCCCSVAEGDFLSDRLDLRWQRGVERGRLVRRLPRLVVVVTGEFAGETAFFEVAEVSEDRAGLTLQGGGVAVDAVEALADARVAAPGFDEVAADSLEFAGGAHVEDAGFRRFWMMARRSRRQSILAYFSTRRISACRRGGVCRPSSCRLRRILRGLRARWR